MRRVIQGLLAISISLVMALTVGCYVSVPSEKAETAIPPGGLLRLELQVAEDEVVEGSWKADEGIQGSYTGPGGAKFAWSLSAAEHTFIIKGAENPGLYVFRFRNSGSEVGTITFQYRVKNIKK